MLDYPRTTTQRAPAPAKVRILEVANGLFYAEGIRTVGIDRLISESSVTKATFYKHYRAKDILIVDYMKSRHDKSVSELEAIIDGSTDAKGAIERWRGSLEAELDAPDFRGCPFLNAAAEFSDSGHQVRQIISEHRDWYVGRLAELLRSAGHAVPGDAADDLMLAKDGAMSGSYAADPVAAGAAFTRAVERVVAEVS
jgi:AcrR family transcriptional regulator